MPRKPLVLAAALTLFLAADIATATGEVDISKAKARAAASGKPILIDFSSPT